VYGFREEFQRHYPQGPVAAHVLGLRDVDNLGRGGVEEACNELLRGKPGERRVRRDARGYVVEVLEAQSRPPLDGTNVQTTLDSLLQLKVEARLAELMTEHRPKSCTSIVMLPDSGEIIALASCPTFDPNRPQEVEPGAWKNQALASMFEPGSTFKPFVVAWALDRGLLERDEELHCGWGAYRMGRRVLHDHHAYGELSVTDVLVKSSNVGMAKIGERLTNVELYRACAAFGFGRTTGLGLPGELPGMLRAFEDWTSYSTGSIPMGQELAATPLQIITAHAALANGGRLVTPRLVRPITNGPTAAVTVVAPVVTPETAAWLVAGPMREVVSRGTGKEAKLPGYSVFGKTGTAQVVDPATGRYSHSRHICSFICGAPASAPEVLVLVVVEEPQGPGVQYGGTVAAPAARDILQAALGHLRVEPDIPSELPAARTAEESGPRRSTR
jgi:cell division protein FtsI/penicillin-binding protein 2